MKKIYIFPILLALSSTLMAQSLGFRDLGLLFTQENYNGTARYNAMSGAFGALGGELSAIYQNPAGGAVFAKSEVSVTHSFSRLNTDAIYYGNTSFNSNTSSRFPQLGIVLVLDSPNTDSNWTKFTFGFNYSMLNDFRKNYSTLGNNKNFVRYNLHPLDSEDIPYNNPEEQYFENNTNGISEVYTLSIASSYKDLFYIGSSLNFHAIKFSQETILNEISSDDNDHILDTQYSQYISESSTGVSFGIGMIVKPFRNLRLGLAYQSPIWYPVITEESNAIDYDPANGYSGYQEQGYLDIYSEAEGYYQNTYSNYPGQNLYEYSLNTPKKWTVSAAITLGQHGLISIDYHQKNYNFIRLNKGYDFSETNKEISNLLTRARGIRGGGELRFNQISLRGGAFLEESPYKFEESNIYKKGISLGLGLKFKNTKLDFAYQYSKTNDQYSIYHSSEPIQNIALLNTTRRITSTLSFTF